MSFLNTFGGSAVSPADVAYAAYTFDSDLVLYWPQFSAGQTNIAARFMNLTATIVSLNVSMPDATLTSTGQDVIIFNAGSDTFNVVDFDGGAIATITTGQTYYLMLNDNTTQAGGWQTVQFGIGTGSASAAALAGAGLLATAGLLNVNLNATTILGNTSLTSMARAILQVWIGGAGTITLPSAGTVGDGFFFPFANDGSGSVTLATVGGQQIDGASTSVFSQTQSAFIVSSGTAWYTVGKGTQTNFAVTILNLNVAGSSDVTETSAQAQNVIQQFTGLLTGNINVIVPATVQLYYVFNNTSGAFTLTVKTASGTGITVDQGSHTILYCDGTDIVNAFTSSFGGALSIAAGSATSPNLNFVGSVTTGIYSPAANQLAVTANGKEVMNFISSGSAVNYLQVQATASGSAPVLSAQGSDTNIGIILSPKGSAPVGIAAALITGGTIDGTVIGGGTPAAITGTTVTGSSIVGPLTGNVTGNVTGTLTGNVVGNVTGNLTGNVTGNVSGSSGSTTGNAATATALQTARTINGVSFDGTANIVVTAAAGTLTGATLASNILASSLTSVGTLATLTVTAPINGSITGNAATVTTNANLTGAVTSVGNVTSITSGSSGASVVWIATQTASNSASITFTSIPSGYDQYILRFTLVVPAVNAQAIGIQLSANNGSPWLTSGYVWSSQQTNSSGGSTPQASASDSAINITPAGVSNTAGLGMGGYIEFSNLTASGSQTQYNFKTSYFQGTADVSESGGGRYSGGNNPFNAIRILAQLGASNITSGIFSLYGVRNA